MKSLISLSPWCTDMVYSSRQIDRIRRLTNLLHDPLPAEELLERPDLLEQAEVIFSGWGGPTLDDQLLALARHLKIYLYAAGASRSIISPTWEQSEVILSTTISFNSLSVAEYTLGAILLGLKRAFALDRWVREHCCYPPVEDKYSPGNYKSTVGIIALGYAGQQIVKLLAGFDHKVIAYDPYADLNWATANGVQLVDLKTLFTTADVVSVHLPVTSSTRGKIKGSHIRLMKHNSTFINTARGQVLSETDVLEALGERSDIQGIFDVAIKEPPEPESDFYKLPNVMLTPHIAGALFGECERMGSAMIDELERFQSDQPLLFEIPNKNRQHISKGLV